MNDNKLTKNKKNKCKKKPLTLYYRVNIPNTDIYGGTEVKFVTDPFDPIYYRGLSNRNMTDSTYLIYNTDIITFYGVRTPESKPLNLPNLYYERVIIMSEPYDKNMIEGLSNYVDKGTSFISEIPTITYYVTIAVGKYKGYTKIIIYINNVDGTRMVELL